MNKIYLLTLLCSVSLFGIELPSEVAQLRVFSKSVKLNSKVIQLSNAQQSITSLLSGHLERYFVEPNQKIKTGDKIALIESIELSNITSKYLSLKKQLLSLDKNQKASKLLYEKGMLSMQDANRQTIEFDIVSSEIDGLKSQLNTLGINPNKLVEPTGNFIIYAHSAGRVAALLEPLHKVIKEDEPLVSIVKEQAFYIKSYLPLEYAQSVKVTQKISLEHNKKIVTTHITQILPELDEQSQRVILLSSIDEMVESLFVGSYLASTLYFDEAKKYVGVKKSALSFFNNEWVVFMHKKENDAHESHDEHKDEDEHEDSFEARVVKIITQDDEYVAVEGLNEGEEYVSDKSYYAKSMMLKSSLDEHGH